MKGDHMELDEIREMMCDKYCKYPERCNEDELMDKCENCPLNEL